MLCRERRLPMPGDRRAIRSGMWMMFLLGMVFGGLCVFFIGAFIYAG